MAKTSGFKQNVLVLIGLGAGLVFAVVIGIVSFVNITSTPVHPNPGDIPSVTQSTPPSAWTGAVERGRQLARATLLEQNLPGLSVAVGVGDELVWAEGFGWADLEKRIPVSPSTRFRIGHASKALTSAAVGLLVEQGRLQLRDEIQTYVPAYPKKDWPVSLRQLMGHTAGVRHYNDEGDYMSSAHCERAAEGVRSFADDPLLFEPETRYGYSTFGWVLVSAAVEAAANQPFFTFMRGHVFAPLGMTDTTWDSAADSIRDRATFYGPRFSGDPATGPELAEKVDYSCFAGAGAFLSTPSDLVRFGLAMSGRKFLQSGTVRLLQTPQILASGEETEYGLGWMLETVPLAGKPTRLASHASRTMVGGSTSFMTFPERGLVVAVAANISKASTKSMALGIAEAFAERK